MHVPNAISAPPAAPNPRITNSRGVLAAHTARAHGAARLRPNTHIATPSIRPTHTRAAAIGPGARAQNPETHRDNPQTDRTGEVLVMTRPPHAPRAAGRAIPHIHAQKRCAWAGPSEARAGYAALDFLRGESSCAGFVGVLTPSPFLRSFIVDPLEGSLSSFGRLLGGQHLAPRARASKQADLADTKG